MALANAMGTERAQLFVLRYRSPGKLMTAYTNAATRYGHALSRCDFKEANRQADRLNKLHLALRSRPHDSGPGNPDSAIACNDDPLAVRSQFPLKHLLRSWRGRLGHHGAGSCGATSDGKEKGCKQGSRESHLQIRGGKKPQLKQAFRCNGELRLVCPVAWPSAVGWNDTRGNGGRTPLASNVQARGFALSAIAQVLA